MPSSTRTPSTALATDALADLLPGPQAQASLYAFDLVERRAKRGAGIPEDRAKHYEEGLRSGKILVGVLAKSDEHAKKLEGRS